MPRVLFLMHEGVGSTIFHSQVAVHALEMKRLGVDVEIWTYETARKSREQSRRNLEALANLGDVRVRLRSGAYVFLPGSAIVNAAVLWRDLRRARGRFDVIHARTDYSASVYSYLSRVVGVPMVWDCRGDAYPETVEALERRRLPAPARRLILRAVARQERRAGAACAAANFVSRLLSTRKARSLRGQPAFVIPCPVSSKHFYFDAALRAQRRHALGLAQDTLVLVYVGGMTSHQGFESYVELVARIIEAGTTAVCLLVVTPDAEQAESQLSARLPSHAYRVCTADYAEVNGYLNAADVGMLLREANAINDVASPTKFGEYCLAGLPVILDGHVQQAAEVAATLGNGESYDAVMGGKRLEPRADDARAAIAVGARAIFARDVLNAEYVRLYDAALSAAPTRG